MYSEIPPIKKPLKSGPDCYCANLTYYTCLQIRRGLGLGRKSHIFTFAGVLPRLHGKFHYMCVLESHDSIQLLYSQYHGSVISTSQDVYSIHDIVILYNILSIIYTHKYVR